MPIYIIYILVLFSVQNLFSQEIMFRSDRPVPFQADSLIGSESSLGPLREYYGNCKWSQEDITLTCDYAKQYLKVNRAHLKGNVKMLQPGMELLSPRIDYNDELKTAKAYDSIEIYDGPSYLIADNGIYNAETKIADFKGRVKVEDDSSLVLADKIKYHRKDRSSFAYGNVSVRGKHTNAALAGDTILHYPDKKYLYASGSPFLLQVDTLMEDQKEVYDTLLIFADKMNAYFDDDERYIFNGSLEIIKNNISAKADSGVFYKKREYFLLYGSPIAFYDSTQLYGDTIKVFLKGNQLEKIQADLKAISVLKDSTTGGRKNQISGERIVIDFQEGDINNILAIGSTKSLYNFASEKGSDGADLKDSDSLRVVFFEGEADKIYWFGGVNGQYIPEGILMRDVNKYNLPDYKWSDSRPFKKEVSIRKER